MRSVSLTTIVILALLIGCSPATVPSLAAPSAAESSATAAPTRPPVPTLSATCELTRPDPPFVAPAPYPARPPAGTGQSWFGNRHLWTALAARGEIWRDLPRDKVGYSQKSFWWSADWNVAHELEPAITVAGRQLDGPATFRTTEPGTNATAAGFGTAMLIGITIPAPGCWELTARYRAAQLSIVVWVAAD